ncbi:MAG TPA: hypothetical protein VL651_14735 [Bacteroidia bacterium]|jgi:hypothetical protein|nr:hypothetical protein [Bacteroidia bacterium]
MTSTPITPLVDEKDKKEPEEKPLRGLVMGANIVSILLIVGIFVTIFMMAGWRKKSRADEADRSMQQITDALRRDSADKANAYSMMVDSINTVVNSTTDASTAELQNELKYSNLDEELGTTGKDQRIREQIDVLKEKANKRIADMEQLKTDLDETVSKNGSYYRISSTQDFFISGGRADKLLNDLRSFRNQTVTDFSNAGVDDMSSTKENLPLDDWSGSSAQSWDIYQFQGDPDNAKAYINQLEAQVRVFEGSVLDQISYNIY